MKSEQSHIIQRQSIEIDFESMGAGMEVQQRLSELFYERLEPEMCKLFDAFIGDKQTATIERLEIDCGILPAKHWEEELVQQVMRKLSDQLRQIDKKNLYLNDWATDTLVFFLSNGILPWNSRSISLSDLEELVILNQFFIERIIKVVRHNSAAKKRLSSQFSRRFKLRLLKRMGEPAQQHFSFPGQAASEEVEGADETIINKLLERVIDSSEIENLSETVKAEKIPPGAQEAEANLPRELYINNAGLVLLHPFLPFLFDNLALTKDNQWLNDQSQATAVLIMQHLISAELDFPEYEIPLNKILCSYPLLQSLPNNIEIDDFIRTACDELLAEVIRQWSRLKNTGVEAFRETFLQRMGKLSRSTNGWLLQVEQKPVDVLLGGLPWGIGVIKLPWMTEILYVEWT